MISMTDVLYFSIGGAMGLVIGIRIVCYWIKYSSKREYLLENKEE